MARFRTTEPVTFAAFDAYADVEPLE
jgi:hypothetical protein